MIEDQKAAALAASVKSATKAMMIAALTVAWIALITVGISAMPLATVMAAEFDGRVAATVQGVPVTIGELQREVRRVLPAGEVPAAARQILEAKALDQLVDRQLILRQLATSQIAATTADIDRVIDRLKKQLDERKSSLVEHLQKAELDEPAFRRFIAWQISWERYLTRFMNEENLQKYFEQHAREFDGSELRVAHLLLKAKPQDDAAAVAARIAKAREIRAEIEAGKLTFAAAVKQHSQAPTADMGGDIGWIKRQEPMPESFSAAAFKLDVKQVSSPVQTAFGVHLIQVLEVKPGKRTWQEARVELEPAMTQYLFQYLADQERSKTKIEYTELAPRLPDNR
ncbi:MAG: peptidylprolyl isomerase [Planctomycetota bacterium]